MLGQYVLGTDILMALGAKINAAIRSGQYWRLITPVFLHANLLHIGVNMYALLAIGPGLERQYGHARYLVLYLLAGFSGNVVSFIFSPYVSLGSSTAIFGLLAAEGIFVYQNKGLFGSRSRSILMNILVIAAINLVIGLTPGIDNFGHLGGLIGGLLFGWFAGPIWQPEGLYPELRLVDQRQPITVELTAIGVFVLFAALAIYNIVR